jgi:hypothetical protein
VCNQLMEAGYLEGGWAWEVSLFNRERVREGRQFPVCTVVPAGTPTLQTIPHLPLPAARDLKVHKHEIFFFYFFAENESLWSQGPVTRDF